MRAKPPLVQLCQDDEPLLRLPRSQQCMSEQQRLRWLDLPVVCRLKGCDVSLPPISTCFAILILQGHHVEQSQDLKETMRFKLHQLPMDAHRITGIAGFQIELSQIPEERAFVVEFLNSFDQQVEGLLRPSQTADPAGHVHIVIGPRINL